MRHILTSLEFLSQFPKHSEFSRRSKILLFAYYLRKYQGKPEFTTKDIRDSFKSAMLKIPGDLSSLLAGQAKGKASVLIRSKNKGPYALSLHGMQEVEGILPAAGTGPVSLSTFLDAAVPYLRRTIAKVKDEHRREYLAEAISCLGVGASRATIVMTWLATIDHMQEFVLSKHATAFNSALAKRSDKLSRLRVASRDDFAEMKESVFIEVCRSAKIVTNDVRKLLDEKLGTRNSCAHPSTITVSDSKVVSFIEDLVENVIARHEL